MKNLFFKTFRGIGTVMAAWVLLCALPLEAAPQRMLKNYHHTAWTMDNGLGAVSDVEQSSEGYLWVTASRGIFRFDGVRFQTVDEATDNAVHNAEIDAAFPSAFGGVWFTTRSRGLLFWKNGRVSAFPDRRCTQGRKPDGMIEDRDGSLWIVASGGLFHLHGGVCEPVGEDRGYSGGFASAILLDRWGTLWVKVPTGDLLFLERGAEKFRKSEYGTAPVIDFAYLHEAPDGSVWLADAAGLRRVTPQGDKPSVADAQNRPAPAHERMMGNFTFAADGALWAATSRGVERFAHPQQMATNAPLREEDGETFGAEQGLSSTAVWKIVTDREGSLWVATNGGLDRLRRNLFTQLDLPPVRDFEMAVVAGTDGSVWTGNREMSLTRVTPDGRTEVFAQTSRVIALRRDRNGAIWSSGKGRSNLWRTEEDKLVPVPFPGGQVEVAASIAVDRNNDTWVSTFGPNMYHQTGKVWRNENQTLGRKPGVLGAMASDATGNVWFAFSNKLVEWDGTSYHRYEFPDGNLNISVTTLMVRDDRVWMGGAGGVVLFRGGRFERMQWKDESLPGRINGIVETASGDLWLNGVAGAVHVPSVEVTHWLRDAEYAVTADHFDTLDGLPGLADERFPEPSLAEGPDGRLWFATTRGVAWLSPAAMATTRNTLPPPIVIEAAVADGKSYALDGAIQLPAHTQNLQIEYTALSLAIPERVSFRYKLEGIDSDWQNAGARREAFYTRLPPGSYRFRVAACNSDGVWNELASPLALTLRPMFYETWWFRALCIAAGFALLWWMVRRWIKNITHQMQIRLAERLAERERIGRELHDTLLQSLFGLMLQFHATVDDLGEDDPRRNTLTRALARAENVMQEGRDRVRDLRSGQPGAYDLVEALTGIGEHLQSLGEVKFQMTVKGLARGIKPVILEEMLLIGREALNNAFLHADAQTIIAELVYMSTSLHLRIRDDGKGIDEAIVKAGGRKDHWGLPGMRERARAIRAELKISREITGGTSIHLRVPGSAAYIREPGPMDRFRPEWLKKKGGSDQSGIHH